MSFLESLPADAHLGEVFGRFDRGLEALLRFHDDVLRANSSLSIAERELLAAYVSAQNDCRFCFNSHRVYAAKYGIAPDLFDAIINDLETAPVTPALRELLAFAGKLTREPARLIATDLKRLTDAGWSDDAIHDAILVVGLFCMMNRIVFGHGVSAHDSLYSERLDQTLAQPQNEREAANAKDTGTNTYQTFGQSLKTRQKE